MLVLGTLDNPIVVRSFGDEQYAGCTGYPADSHVTIWLTVSSPGYLLLHLVILLGLDIPRNRMSTFKALTYRKLIAFALLDVPRPARRTVPRVW